jgi:hypothetical protein
MYRVSSIPRPALGRFLAQCVGFGFRRGARYGLIWGAGYGALFYLVGAVVGAPIGLAFGAAVGALDGLICGLVLYHKSTIFTDRQFAFRCLISIFSFLACVIGSQIVLYGQDTYHPWIYVSMSVVILPSLIAGICGYRATGELLRWYVKRWVLGEPEGTVQSHARAGVLSVDFWPSRKASPDSPDTGEPIQ